MTVDRSLAKPDSGNRQSARGSMDDYAALYRREFRHVARTVYLIVHDVGTAEEITQEAFLHLVQHWSKIERYDRPDAWVRRVAIRLAVRQVRRERARGLLERQASPHVDQGFEEPMQAAGIGIDVLNAVGRLPARQRAAIVLFYFEDRTVSEISEVMACSQSAAKVWLHRGRHRLAELLGEEVPDDVA